MPSGRSASLECETSGVGNSVSWTLRFPPTCLLVVPLPTKLEAGALSSGETSFGSPPDRSAWPVGALCQALSGLERPLQTTTECPGLWQFAQTWKPLLHLDGFPEVEFLHPAFML